MLPLLLLGGTGFSPTATDFDGSTNYITRTSALTGVSNHADGLMSFWMRLDGGNSTNLAVLDMNDSGLNNFIRRNSSGKMEISWANAGGTGTFGYYGSTTLTSGSAWKHIILAWRWNATLVQQMYIDSVAETLTDTSNVGGPDTFYYNASDFGYRIGDNYGSNTSGSKFNGCMAEFYFAPGQYLDLSVAANIQKFRSTSGRPVSLGVDGSKPTGTAPAIYFSGTFASNLGAGGAFTSSGELRACSTKP